MTELKTLRYFAPSGSEFPAGWYLTDNDDGVTRTGSAIAADDTTVYDVANRIIIDGNTPSTPAITGGEEADEFLIKSDAASVTINDDAGVNVIVFDVDVIITSITSGTAGDPPVDQYVITLDGGNTITVVTPANFTFQHFGDSSEAIPILGADFVTAYGTGFTPRRPTATPATDVVIDEDNDYEFSDTPADLMALFGFSDLDGNNSAVTSSFKGVYIKLDTITDGRLFFVASDNTATEVTVDNASTLELGGSNNDGAPAIDGYIYVTFDKLDELKLTPNSDFNGDLDLVYRVWDGEDSSFDATLTITVTPVNDAPRLVPEAAIGQQDWTVGQSISEIDLSGLFTDVDDADDSLKLTVTFLNDLDAGFSLGDLGLIFNPANAKITGTLRSTLFDSDHVRTGANTIKIVASDGKAESETTININIEPALVPLKISGASEGEVAAGGQATTVMGDISITGDPGSTPLPSIRLVSGVGVGGMMAFDVATGTWTYTLDNTDEDVQTLKSGETLVETFRFNADGLSRPDFIVEITVIGANDAPVANMDGVPAQTGQVGQAIAEIDLSTLFTDPDEDSLTLTFMVTLADGSMGDLAAIGLSYNSETNEITGKPSKSGTHTIIVTASDGNNGTASSTFTIEVEAALPIVVRARLNYDAGEVTVIDAADLQAISDNIPGDPSIVLYTIKTLPTGSGEIWKDATPLNAGDDFTQADINAGRITYRPPASGEGNDEFTFTVSDGVRVSDVQTLQIVPLEVLVPEEPDQDNTIDLSTETTSQRVEAGDGSDIITGGQDDDQIDGGAGDDDIILTRDDNGNPVDAGADEVLYTFDHAGIGIDGSDAIRGFKRGQDKLKLVVNSDRSDISTLTEFLQSLEGADGEALTDDDAFIVTMVWGFDENSAFYFDGVLLHFKEASAFSNGPLSSPVVQITFDERLDFDDLVEILGGAENVANNFDGGLTAFKNLDEVLPRLFGENSIDFEVRPIDEVSVIDGPVASAEVFFDLNGDGEVTDAEKDAQRDDSGRSRYLTGEDGTTQIPEQYVGRAFVADVDGAYDTVTGARLKGTLRSLDNGEGGIATPITDWIATYLEEIEGMVNAPTTAQEVLNTIFGDGVITVADILDIGNYEVPESGAADEAKKLKIINVAFALSEIKKNNDLADIDDDGSATNIDIITAVSTLVQTPDDASIIDLKAIVDARISTATAVRDGRPIATPADVEINEDTDYDFPDTPEALTELFGFLDPGGNSSGADASSFRGVYIKIDLENASLWLDDGTTKVTAANASTLGLGGSNNDGAPPISGYIYVTIDKLDELIVQPAADFNGALKLVYRVWDGEAASLDADLVINVAGVNEDIPIGITGDRGAAGSAETDMVFVLGEDGRLTLADGTDAGVITIVDTKTPPGQLSFDISGAHGDLFEVVLLDHDRDAGTPDAWVLRMKDSATALPSGDDYTITIVATDAEGATFRRDLRIKQGGLYIYDVAGTDDGSSRVFSDGKAVLEENEDGSGTPVTIGAIRNEFTQGPNIKDVRLELVSGQLDSDQFMIERGDGADDVANTADDVFVLKFIGSDSGDADIATDNGDAPGVLNVRIREIYTVGNLHEETVDEDGEGSFVGTKDIDASGDTTDDDTRVFALSGGGLNARDFIYQDLLDAGETSESLSSSEERKASIFTGTLDFSNVAIAVRFEGPVVGGRFSFNIDVIFPEDFKSGDTIWIRFSDGRHDSVRGVEVVIRISGDGTSLIFTPTGAVKVVELSRTGLQLSTENAYQIDFDNPELTDFFEVTFTASSDTFTSNSWHISRVFVDGVEVVASRLLDNIDRKVRLDNTNYDATVNATLSIVADEGGPAGNNIRVVVQIGTAANPTTGEKGIESVSVVDDVITVVTYSEGATWQNVADAINDDTNAGALVDVVATLATAEDDAEAVDLYLSGGENTPPLEENTNARLIDVEGGWIYPDDADAIRFEAKVDLRLDLSTGEAEVIVVPTGDVDENGVRIGEVRLLASGATKPDEYYVIGTTGVLSNDMDSSAMAEAVLEIDGKEYLKFTSVKLGALGNGQEIQVVFSDASNTTRTFFADLGGFIRITIHRNSTRSRFENTFPTISSITQLVDFEFIGEFEDAGFFNDPAFAYLFDGRTYNLTLDIGKERVQTAPTPATGTEVTTPEVITRQGESTETHIHDYQINLDNTDDNAPVFGQTARIGIKGASDDGQGTVINAKVTNVVEDQDLIITAKIVGTAGNTITVEFEIGSASGRGVESIMVGGSAIKFVLKADGATVEEIKDFFDNDASAGAVAARVLVEITIADGKDTAQIKTAIAVTALSGGSTDTSGAASIDENDTDPGVIFQALARDADGDVVTYSLTDGFSLFEIDADTGEITLIEGESADFEVAASYTLQVVATSSFEGEAPKTTSFKVVVQVNDVAETGSAASDHILIGGEDAQTLNASDRGDVIFGGQGDDTINLGAGRDTVIYRYDATDKTNPAAIDGGDVINSFDLSEDHLFLAHVGATDSTLNTATAFFEAIKGVRLLVDEDGRISGIVFTFTGRVNEAQNTDLTVNFDEGFDASQINLDASFDAAVSGERVITTGQETAAYQAINQVLGESLALIDFADVGFELNSGETDIL